MNTFDALLNEAHFTRNILGAGVTQIRKANYAQKGMYFQSFSSLSIGLERISKLCIVLDYYTQHNGVFPTNEYIKKEIGHDLIKLYIKSIDIINTYQIPIPDAYRIDFPICLNILTILSQFAKGDRYANLNFLTGIDSQNDPIANWWREIDGILFYVKVSPAKRKRIEHNANIAHNLFNDISHIRHTNEDGTKIDSVGLGSFLTGMNEAIGKYRQLYVLYIIRYWAYLLKQLQHAAMRVGRNEIPWFNEIFSLFLNSDSYLKTRKTFDKD